MTTDNLNEQQWITVCNESDLTPDTGLCALHQGEQVARQRISRSKIISVSVEEETVLALDSKGKLSLFTLQ